MRVDLDAAEESGGRAPRYTASQHRRTYLDFPNPADSGAARSVHRLLVQVPPSPHGCRIGPRTLRTSAQHGVRDEAGEIKIWKLGGSFAVARWTVPGA